MHAEARNSKLTGLSMQDSIRKRNVGQFSGWNRAGGKVRNSALTAAADTEIRAHQT